MKRYSLPLSGSCAGLLLGIVAVLLSSADAHALPPESPSAGRLALPIARPLALPADQAHTDSRTPAPPVRIYTDSEANPSSRRDPDDATPIPTPLVLRADDPRAPLPPRAPGWTYRLRLWDTIGRVYAANHLPPPLPADLRAAVGGDGGTPLGDRRSERAEEDGDRLNVLLMGSDRRDRSGMWRTDTLVLVSFDAAAGRAGLLSIPRDLWVSIPGYGPGRINTADYLGHAGGLPDGELVRETVALNLGIPVDHFVRVDLQGFVAAVDALGGVEIAVDCALEDRFYDPEALGGEQVVELETGVHQIDGKTALRYARSRWTSSDFDRSKRQQRLLRALLAKTRQEGFMRRVPDLWKALEPHVETDVSAREIPGLALMAVRAADGLELETAVLGHPATIDWTTPDGAQVLLLEPYAAGAVLDRVLGYGEESVADEGNSGTGRAWTSPGSGQAWAGQVGFGSSLADARPDPETPVAVFNASGHADWAAVMAMRLDEAGVRMAALETRPKGPQSAIFHAEDAAETAFAAAKALNIPPQAVHLAEDWPGRPPSDTPVWAHLGSDWEACPRGW